MPRAEAAARTGSCTIAKAKHASQESQGIWASASTPLLPSTRSVARVQGPLGVHIRCCSGGLVRFLKVKLVVHKKSGQRHPVCLHGFLKVRSL